MVNLSSYLTTYVIVVTVVTVVTLATVVIVVTVVTVGTVLTVVTLVTVVTKKTFSQKNLFFLNNKNFHKKNSKTQIVIKLKNSNCDKTQKLNL